jgi:3-oxoadipyl-CoA thiolase
LSGATEAFICEAARTPIGRFGGSLAHVRPDDLATTPIRALTTSKPDIDWAAVDEVVMGCANQAGEDNRNVARMAALLAGLPSSVPGTTINRLCASGLDAVGVAARSIRAGETSFVIAGGVESMTRAPLVMGKAETAFQRTAAIEDTTIGWRFINHLMKVHYGVDSMPETAENVAQDFQVSRADQDRFALQSQQRAARAQSAGWFAEEITPVQAKDAKGRPLVFEADEHLRPDTTLEALSKLKTPFRKDGSVTAGNASGVNDGAAAMLVASEEAARRHGLTPRARVLGMATAGVEPRVMGLGPIPATQKLIARLGLTIGDFDLIELNEAFASQVIAVLRALGVDPKSDIVNPQGGGIALGHPLGMSGARLAMTATQQMQRTGAKRALVTLCVGVGQGVAMALERV